MPPTVGRRSERQRAGLGAVGPGGAAGRCSVAAQSSRRLRCTSSLLFVNVSPTRNFIAFHSSKKQVMKTIPIYLCRLVSLLGLVCSGFCFWYVASMGSNILGSPPRKGVPDHFVEWYVGLSAIAVLIALCVFVGSVELARLRLRGVQLLTLSSFLPMPLLMVVGGWWVSPMGKSIAAATGVGLGGLVPMMITLLPLWAGLLWSKVFRPTSLP